MTLEPHVVATIETMRQLAHRALELQRDAANLIILYHKYKVYDVNPEALQERFPGLDVETMHKFMEMVLSTINNKEDGVYLLVAMKGL